MDAEKHIADDDLNYNWLMKILAIETSCDETAAAIAEGATVLSSVKVTQEIHSQWGGVVPSLAKRDHEKNIAWVVEKAMKEAEMNWGDISAIAVTVGPGLAIALEVGIKTAWELGKLHSKPIVAVNHVEGHILSALMADDAEADNRVGFPAAALVVSGGHTQVVLVTEIGKYEILAESLDDDIGEAIDKGARALGLGYPGGPELEKRAKLGESKAYPLPLPMAGRELNTFSYSGLKVALVRLVKSLKQNGDLSEQQINDLAATYQAMVFKHLLRITQKVLQAKRDAGVEIRDLLVGGGVIANKHLQERLKELGEEMGIKVHLPTQMVFCTDNAAMIGLVGGYKAGRGEFVKDVHELDRKPRWRVTEI